MKDNGSKPNEVAGLNLDQINRDSDTPDFGSVAKAPAPLTAPVPERQPSAGGVGEASPEHPSSASGSENLKSEAARELTTPPSDWHSRNSGQSPQSSDAPAASGDHAAPVQTNPWMTPPHAVKPVELARERASDAPLPTQADPGEAKQVSRSWYGQNNEVRQALAQMQSRPSMPAYVPAADRTQAQVQSQGQTRTEVGRTTSSGWTAVPEPKPATHDTSGWPVTAWPMADKPKSAQPSNAWPGAAAPPEKQPATPTGPGGWPIVEPRTAGQAGAAKPSDGPTAREQSSDVQPATAKSAAPTALSGSENSDPKTNSAPTRPGEIEADAGKIGLGGLTPDGREHPFGLAGRMFDGYSTLGQISEPANKVNQPADNAPGARPPGQQAQTDNVTPGILGPLFDGHGGMRPPDIKLPFGGKGAKADPDEIDKGGRKADTSGIRGSGIKTPDSKIIDDKISTGKSARSDSPPKSPAETLVAMIDKIKGGIGGGARTIPQDRNDRSIKSGLTGAQGQTSVTDGAGRKAPGVRPDRSGKTNAIAGAGKQTKVDGELIVTGVKTRPWPTAKDGSQATTVGILSPYFSGTSRGVRVTSDVSNLSGKKNINPSSGAPTKETAQNQSDNPFILGSKLKPMVIDPGLPVDESKFLAGDTLKVKQFKSEDSEEEANKPAEPGRFKSRPSVNMHLPGGTYGGTRDDLRSVPRSNDKKIQDDSVKPSPEGHAGAQESTTSATTEPATMDEAIKEKESPTSSDKVLPPTTSVPVLPWLPGGPQKAAEESDEAETHIEHFDHSPGKPERKPPTWPAPKRNLPERTREKHEAHRPAKAIDELSSTVEMEDADAWRTQSRKNRNDQSVPGATRDKLSTEPVVQKMRESLSETVAETATNRTLIEERYRYIVKEGDTVESVASTVLQDPMLAALLFAMNRRYILPEEHYGVHPLMIGVVIQLPTPGDVVKFRKAQQA